MLLTMVWHAVSILAFLFSGCRVVAQNLSDEQVQQVVARLAESATHSWELGTRAQAMLELNAPFYSVFSEATLPPPRDIPTSSRPANLTDVVGIARFTISNLQNASAPPPQPLVANDGAAGDPPSIGCAVLIANWTNATGDNYAAAATGQLEHLLITVPKTEDGAISHRESQVQLWSDFVYMVPPFLAYYGVMNQNQSVLAEAYNQIKLYRHYLRDAQLDNLWRHIALGAGTDDGHWSTGNGWAAAGILRVLATIARSDFADQFQSEQIDLTNWAMEILNGMYEHRTNNHLFHNYADDSSTFEDASSAALIAASTYRLAVLAQMYHNLPYAESTRKSLSDGSHLDQNGWLMPVVNPTNVGIEGAQSPEGQAFVVVMHAAWQDWVAIGSPGANTAFRTAVTGTVVWTVAACALLVIFAV